MLSGSQVSTDVERWFDEGDEAKIEQLLLEGRSYLLEGKEPLNPKILNFMRTLPIYKVCPKNPIVITLLVGKH
jgi:hypothetical protein